MMARDGRDRNELRRPEESSREGLITYRRKKRARTIDEGDEVGSSTSCKERIRDIGWTHGEVVNGNRFHWKCNWCGLIRYGGGVSRLKKHLAGVCHVRKCPKVPEAVANAMRNHLLEKQKEREEKMSNHSINSHLCPNDDLTEKEHTIDLDSQFGSVAGLIKGITHQNKMGLTKSFRSHKIDKEAHKGNAANLAKEGNKHGIIFQKSSDSHKNVINAQVVTNKRRSRSGSSHRNDTENHVENTSGIFRLQVGNATVLHEGDHVESVTELVAGTNKADEILVQRCKSDLSNEMRFQLGTATRYTEGAQGSHGTRLNDRCHSKGKIIVKRSRSHLKSGEAHMNRVSKLIKKAQFGNAPGLTEEAIRKSKTIIQNFDIDHSNEMEARSGSATQLAGLIKQFEGIIHRSRNATEQSNTVEQLEPDIVKVSTQLAEGLIKQSEGIIHRSRDATGQSNTVEEPENDIVKGTKDIGNTISFTNLYEQDEQSRTDSHWRNILKDTSELPDISQGGGILNCFRNALTCGSVFTKRNETIDILNQPAVLKNRDIAHPESKRPDSSVYGSSCASGTETSAQKHPKTNTAMCQKLLLEVLRSESFVLLCDLLCENFQDVKAKSFFNFNLINSKMKDGAYEHSPSLFNRDMGQVWEKFRNVGQQMVILASSLSNMSQDSCQEQVLEVLAHEVNEYCEPEGACHVVAETKKSMESSQFTVCNSDNSIKPDEIETSCICKQCGMEAYGEGTLICCGCEVRCHLSCVDHTVMEVPAQNWYCSACKSCIKKFPIPDLAHAKKCCMHQNCTVHHRHGISDTEDGIGGNDSSMVKSFDSMTIPVSRMHCDDSRVSWTAMSGLCKICGVCEDKDQKFLMCGNVHCRYKFYHERCLKSSQIASPQQQSRPRWYCPYCLCRSCLTHKDDDKLVLCDDCYEPYHIYCMNPPLSSLPKGQWYCVACEVARAMEGMKRYEQWSLQKRRKDDVAWSSEAHRSMDLLLRAAETLRSEE